MCEIWYTRCSEGEQEFLQGDIMKVFLGGTCNNSTWRDDLIKMLEIDYFNPVVDDWTPDCINIENREKERSDFLLFVITKEMTGVYSIAEVVDASNKAPEKTVLCILPDGFTDGQNRSLQAVMRLVEENGAAVFIDLETTAEYLNGLVVEVKDTGKYFG
jgi:hypothetical protein